MATKTIDNSYKQQLINVYQYLINIGTPSAVAENIIKQVLFIFSQYKSSQASQINQTNMRMKLLQLSIRLSISVYSSQTAATTDCDNEQVSKNNYHGNCHGNYHANYHAIVCSLDPIYKHILGLRYYLNMSYQEIAEILELDPKQVLTFMHEARRRCL